MKDSTGSIPAHVGLILDGNRRWAKKHGKTSFEGHKHGSDVFQGILEYLFDRKIRYVSAYVFSKENWKRTEKEVSYLMGLFVKVIERNLEELHSRNIQIKVLGGRDRLSATVVRAIENSEEKTKNNDGGVLCFCFNYGGKQEIVDSAKAVLANGEELSDESISRHLYAPDVPPLDLIIRTSGENRLSGFMLWRSDYAELYFTDTLWPDMKNADIDDALEEYSKRKRRYGK